MSRTVTVERVGAALREVFTELDSLFELPRHELERREQYQGAWSWGEHLEHVSLANHFLLLTITKGCRIALKRAVAGGIQEPESDLELLAPVALPGAFDWDPPLHMVPTGRRDAAEVREELKGQRDQALSLLGAMPNGEGRLYSIRMSVHALGRLDMYQWLYFLAQHARYHLIFMERQKGARVSGRE